MTDPLIDLSDHLNYRLAIWCLPMKNVLLSALPLLFLAGSAQAQFDLEESSQALDNSSVTQPASPVITQTLESLIEPALPGAERPEAIDETLILRGQITGFDFTQPETRILIDAESGHWELVAPSAVELRRLGWTSSSLFSGELVEVEVARRSGTQKTASLKRLTRANGALLLTSLNNPEHRGFKNISGGMYSLDTGHANLEFTYNHMGFSDIPVRFERLRADVLWNAESPETSIIRLNVDASSLRSGNDQLDEGLRGAEFFDTLNYPAIEFRSTRIRLLKWGNLQIDGQLNIKGLSRPVKIEARLNKSGVNPLTQNTTVGIGLKGNIARSNWGLTAYSASIPDQIGISFQGEFILRVAGGPSAPPWGAPLDTGGRLPLDRSTLPDRANDNALQSSE